LVPGVSGLGTAEAVNVVEGEDLVWVGGSLERVPLLEEISKGLGVDDPAAMTVKHHGVRKAGLAGNAMGRSFKFSVFSFQFSVFSFQFSVFSFKWGR